MNDEIKGRLLHLFLSRRFLALAISTVLLVFDYIDMEIFKWIVIAVLSTNTIDKFKDSITIGKP